MTLFDLLADPRGCATWHSHPAGCEVDKVDAPPGPALEGAEFRTTGRLRGVAYGITTKVTIADRPATYATEGEQIVEHPRAILVGQVYTERFTIASNGAGSSVTYETRIWRSWRSGLFVVLVRSAQRLIDRFSAARQTRHAIGLLLGSAERRAAVGA